jgi:hypothetical protein
VARGRKSELRSTCGAGWLSDRPGGGEESRLPIIACLEYAQHEALQVVGLARGEQHRMVP